MESIVPGVPDRGGNDHYALRGRIAWQPGDSTDVNLIVRYLEANGETQAGLYSHEPACPNDKFQGEFTTPTESASTGRGTRTARARPAPASRNRSIIPSRGGDPYKTAETEPSYVDREIFGAQIRIVTDVGAGTLTSITDYQTSDKFYTEGGDASPDDGVYFFQGADLDQISQEFRYAWSSGPSRDRRGPVRHVRRRRLHRQVRRAASTATTRSSPSRRRRLPSPPSSRTSGASRTAGS